MRADVGNGSICLGGQRGSVRPARDAPSIRLVVFASITANELAEETARTRLSFPHARVANRFEPQVKVA